MGRVTHVTEKNVKGTKYSVSSEFMVHAESDINGHNPSRPVSVMGAGLTLGVELGSSSRAGGAALGESAEILEDWEEGAEEPVYTCACLPGCARSQPCLKGPRWLEGHHV